MTSRPAGGEALGSRPVRRCSGATQEEAPASRPSGGESFGITTGTRKLQRHDRREVCSPLLEQKMQLSPPASDQSTEAKNTCSL